MFSTDECEHCKGTIYPNDESVSVEFCHYHFDCAVILDIEDNDD